VPYERCSVEEQSINIVDGRVVSSKHNTSIHNILSTAPQLSISHKALETLPENENLMPKHIGDTTHN
jgi:hypothetical protein